MNGRLQGKTTIVTGAGRGIGEATALRFAEEGASVVVADLNPENGARVAEELNRLGGTARFIQTDVTDFDSVSAMTARAERELGPIDVLVNNAGANVFHNPLEMPPEDWDKCLNLDLRGCWYCARAVLAGMSERGQGSIINIGSVHSFQAMRGTFPYPVAKHAVIGLTRSLGIEFAAQGIRVNAIAPGYIETQIAIDYWNTFPDPAAERKRAEVLHPPQRIGKPVEVANTAVFLASDEAPFINGATIVIDGGRSVLYHD